MIQLILQYLEQRKQAWAPTTLKSERARLRVALPFITGDAQTLWNGLAHQKPYTRQTTWTRVADFYQWCIDNNHVSGGNPYVAFRETNARLFKNSYTRRKCKIDYAEAERRIARMPNEEDRKKATELLSAGLRYEESFTLNGDNEVVGKGGKVRTVYPALRALYGRSYSSFRRALAAVGLKPHDLRKILLSAVAAQNPNAFELCEIAGWNSIQTATSYINVNSARPKQLVQQVRKVK